MEAFITYKFVYDDKGNRNRVEKHYYPSNQSHPFIDKYIYDDKGNQIEENSYDIDGILNSKSKYVYDDDGNQIECENYNSDGSFRGKLELRYDKKGNLIEEEFFNSDGSFDRKVEYVYDDDKGNIIARKENNGSFIDKTEYGYTYFSRENWIKRVSWVDLESSYTKEIYCTERKIEYFD
jgi:hypothetical protein